MAKRFRHRFLHGVPEHRSVQEQSKGVLHQPGNRAVHKRVQRGRHRRVPRPAGQGQELFVHFFPAQRPGTVADGGRHSLVAGRVRGAGQTPVPHGLDMGQQREAGEKVGAEAEILFQRHCGHHHPVGHQTATEQLRLRHTPDVQRRERCPIRVRQFRHTRHRPGGRR